MKKLLNKKILTIIKIFKENNFNCYIVGGAIRNFLIDREVNEFDLTTNAKPKHIKELFKKHIDIGEKFGCIKIFFEDEWFEITTLRIEDEYLDFRHANSIKFIDSPYIDVLRRDFTINSIYFDGVNLIDPLNGIYDIKNKLIRSVGNSKFKFSQDPLRILRCVRFKSELNFNIEINTLISLKSTFHLIKNLSKYKVHEELKKTFEGQNKKEAIKLLIKLKLFNILIDENISFNDISNLMVSINEFHIQLFCLLFFHSNLNKITIPKVLCENFNFKKSEIKDLKNIYDSILSFDNSNLYFKNLILKYNYDFSHKIALILSNYIDKNSIKKFLKIKWGYSPVKYSHIKYDIYNNVKNKKSVNMYKKYIITLLIKYPHLNNKYDINHLIKNLKS